MFPSHFKIPGYSSTDIEYHKAFQQLKAYNKRNPSSHYGKKKFNSHQERISDPDKYRVKRIDLILKYGIRLPVFLSFIAITFLLGSNYLNTVLFSVDNPDNKIIQKQVERKEITNAYMNLTYSGYEYLHANQLDLAQQDFILALYNDKYGKSARFGLMKVFVKKCELNGVYCEEAKANIDYIRIKKLMSDEELKPFVRL